MTHRSPSKLCDETKENHSGIIEHMPLSPIVCAGVPSPELAPKLETGVCGTFVVIPEYAPVCEAANPDGARVSTFKWNFV
mmetsp:Transcript_68185/g.134681  ORF Transcript_68185/g.134681 Transcript_68185/m.134681 type:complete len:80 (-) Transcript_68185:1197-1436(-)